MSLKGIASRASKYLRIGFTSMVLFHLTVGGPLATTAQAADANDNKTTSPIKHVIVIIGENRSFDHVFATYVPRNGESINNLLSEGIIKLDAKKNAIPGPNFAKAQQLAATDTDTFLLSPPKQQFPNNNLPAPLVGGPSGANGYFSGDNPCGTSPPISALACAQQTESGLADLSYYQDLVSGGTGQ